VTHIIAEPCVGVRSADCFSVCPVDCIYTGNIQSYIHPEECIDCGLCVDACSVQAIFPIEEVPNKWNRFIAKNYEWFHLSAP
jgi:NAD-dependent dihydropyrimidine dehydrogenase PreA subunit